jgi:catechol 2,3-dioxygenase-like lactoylglutathione lyase family enzyme
MATIRYLAILSHDPDSLAGFYKTYMAMRELGRSSEGDVTVSDGGFNVTIFKQRPELHELNKEPGFHHLGIAVDSLDEIEERYRKFYPRGTVVRESGDLQHGEMRIYDPECHPVTVSARNFHLGANAAGVPRIAHIAMGALDPSAVYDFYANVFGFPEMLVAHADAAKRPGYRNRHVGDGFTNVAIQAFYNDREGHEARHGIAHIGYVVEDAMALADSAAGVATLTRRPSSRVQSEVRMRDPQGNGYDLSRRGWEVGIDKWAKVEAV